MRLREPQKSKQGSVLVFTKITRKVLPEVKLLVVKMGKMRSVASRGAIRQHEWGQKQQQVGNSHSEALPDCRNQKTTEFVLGSRFVVVECLLFAEGMEESGNEGRPFSILFRGCSFLIVYEVGVVAALRELAPDILKSASRIYGASSGAVVATLVLCECDIGKDDVLRLFCV
ncbi:hypothetical protein Q9233_008329 [Columba guinea]|nr:hypothetical protein Q9233_008329 [Columba guinea]